MSLSGFSVKRGLFVPSGGIVKLSTAWSLNSYTAASTVTTSITFNTDGSITTVTNDTSIQPDSDNWWTDNPETAVGDDYEVAYTAISAGAFLGTSPAINSWQALTSNVTWSVRVLSKNAPDTASVIGVTWEIRPAGGGASLDTITGCAMSASN